MTTAVAEPGPERQMRKRHISLSAEAPAATHSVHVSAGDATVLLFDSPLLPASLELGTSRERFERIDVTEHALILLPRQDLMPHERVLLTVRFADGHIPNLARFTLVSEPEQLDLQVRIFRSALAPEVLVERLGSLQERCEDTGRFANFLFSRRPGGSIVARPLLVRWATKADRAPSPVNPVKAQAFIASTLFAIELALQLDAGHPAWRPGLVEIRQGASRQPIPLRAKDLDQLALQPGTLSVLVLELPVEVLLQPWPLSITLHELGGDRRLDLMLEELSAPGEVMP